VLLSGARLVRQAGGPEEKDFREWELKTTNLFLFEETKFRQANNLKVFAYFMSSADTFFRSVTNHRKIEIIHLSLSLSFSLSLSLSLSFSLSQPSEHYPLLFSYQSYAMHLLFQKSVLGGVSQEPLNQSTYHADDFVLAPVVVVITH
jgi:hypothetical protein